MRLVARECYVGAGLLAMYDVPLSAVKAGSTFSGSKLVHAWCFETILITNCYIFGSKTLFPWKRPRPL